MTRRFLVTFSLVPLATANVSRPAAAASAPATLGLGTPAASAVLGNSGISPFVLPAPRNLVVVIPAPASPAAAIALPEFSQLLQQWRASAAAAAASSTELPRPDGKLGLVSSASTGVVSDQTLPAALGDWSGAKTAPGVSTSWGPVAAGSTFNATSSPDGWAQSTAPPVDAQGTTGSYLNWLSGRPLDDHVAQLELALASGGQVNNPDGSPGTLGEAVSAQGLLNLPLGWKLDGDWTRSDLTGTMPAQTWDISASGTIEHPWGQAKATASLSDVDAGYASLANPTPATGSRSGKVTVRQDVAKGPLTGTIKVIALGSTTPNLANAASGDEIGRSSAEGTAKLRFALLPKVALVANGSLTALNQDILGSPADSATTSAVTGDAPVAVASAVTAAPAAAPSTPVSSVTGPVVAQAPPPDVPIAGGAAAAIAPLSAAGSTGLTATQPSATPTDSAPVANPPVATPSPESGETAVADTSSPDTVSATSSNPRAPYYADQSQVGAADVGVEWKLMRKTALTALLGGTHTGVNRFVSGAGWDPAPVSLLNEYRLSLALTQQNREGSWSMSYARKNWDDMLAESGLTSLGYSGRSADVLSLSCDRPLLFKWRLHAGLDWADTVDSTLTQPQAHRVQVGLQMQKFGSLNFSFCDGAAYASDGLDGSSDVNLTFRTGAPIGNQHLSLDLGYTREGALASAPISDFTVGVTYR